MLQKAFLVTFESFRRAEMFDYLVCEFNDFINTEDSGSLTSLLKIGIEFKWHEGEMIDWYSRIQPFLTINDYR